MLVEKDKNMDLKQALQLAADAQPIRVDASTIDNVRTKSLLNLYNSKFNVFLPMVTTINSNVIMAYNLSFE